MFLNNLQAAAISASRSMSPEAACANLSLVSLIKSGLVVDAILAQASSNASRHPIRRNGARLDGQWVALTAWACAGLVRVGTCRCSLVYQGWGSLKPPRPCIA